MVTLSVGKHTWWLQKQAESSHIELCQEQTTRTGNNAWILNLITQQWHTSFSEDIPPKFNKTVLPTGINYSNIRAYGDCHSNHKNSSSIY